MIELALDKGFTLKSARASVFLREKLKFPGGETHIKLFHNAVNYEDGVLISSRFSSNDDLFNICLAVEALGRYTKNISLCLPYFPYARQDRLMVNGEPLSVKVAANLINSLNFRNVYIYDPHSDVTPALINNCFVATNEKFVNNIINTFFYDNKSLLIVSPDAGAEKKVKRLNLKNEVCFATKVRDMETGKIINQKLSGEVDGRDCLIVDDICDGGRTFTELAKILKDNCAGKIYLAVSHGIFSKGLSVFDGLIEGVFCTNSYPGPQPAFVYELSMSDWMFN